MGSGRPGSVGPGGCGEASELWWRGAGVEGGLRAPACVGDGDGGLRGACERPRPTLAAKFAPLWGLLREGEAGRGVMGGCA